jgi:hypothetical protein
MIYSVPKIAPKETPTFTEYTECQAFCPVVGPPNPPHPQAIVAPTLWVRGGGGGHTLQGKTHLCIPFLGIARP